MTNHTNAQMPTESVPEPAFMFDYRYADGADIQAVTVEHLAKLEVELHTLRMMYVANGENVDLMVAPGRPIGAEMQKIEAAIHKLESYFAPLLATGDATV